MIILTLEIMSKMWPHGNQHVPGLLEGISKASETVFPKYGLTTSLVIAHAMAQFSEECGQGLEMVESLNYTTTRLLQIFPTHFTLAMAKRWAHNQRMIGNIAYGGRMGNDPPPSDDGYHYRGRGLSQVTGKEGYMTLQKKLDENHVGINILTDPDLINNPDYTLECGVLDFIICGCLPYAEKDDVLGVTRKLNGGTNGLPERKRQLALWKKELNV
jgi:putative chitinase